MIVFKVLVSLVQRRGGRLWFHCQDCIQRGGGTGIPPPPPPPPPPPELGQNPTYVEYKKILGEHATRPPRGRTNVWYYLSPPPHKKILYATLTASCNCVYYRGVQLLSKHDDDDMSRIVTSILSKQFSRCSYTHFNLRREDNLSIKDKMWLVPNVSIIQRFHRIERWPDIQSYSLSGHSVLRRPPLYRGHLCKSPMLLFLYIFNPRRACAARVTVVVLCVCLSVCLSVC